jgi:hypothetical protein
MLLFGFLFRLGFGLCSDFWTSVDNKQIYLIGLKFYTTGSWPYFGPDVTSSVQIPGALQGILVGLPFFVLPIPEAPFLLLSVLSFASLSLLAWYSSRRVPELSKWIVWWWLLTAPWTLNVSTNIYNPSYVLTGSILFFVGALETYPFTTENLIPSSLAPAMMGFGLLWVMQLHLSWVILMPFVALAFWYQTKTYGKKTLGSIAGFIAGAAIPGALLLPTYLRYGFASVGNMKAMVEFNASNLTGYFTTIENILWRFLSFTSFEIPRFIGNHTATRLEFLKLNPWLIPFAAGLAIVGFLQPVSLIWLWFSRKQQRSDWVAIKYVTLGTVILLYIAFLFSAKAPASHTFYVTIPIALLYGMYCWRRFLIRPNWYRFAAILIGCNIIFHAGLALSNFRRTSLYLDRSRIVEAIRANDFHLVAERPPGAKY